MKKIDFNKKKILIILTAILFLIILSNYIKTAEIPFLKLFNEDESPSDELFFNENGVEDKIEAVNDEQKTVPKKTEKIIKSNIDVKNEKEKGENIILISEIKDPFAAKDQGKPTSEQLSLISKGNKSEELIYLENNIIAEKLKIKNKNEAELTENQKIESEKKKRKKDRQLIPKINLPFELLGIIKNETNAAALFLYQGQKILKKEKEKIDIFKIETIKNQEINISYQNETIKIYLWKGETNEN